MTRRKLSSLRTAVLGFALSGLLAAPAGAKVPACPVGAYPVAGGTSTLSIVTATKPVQIDFTGCGTGPGSIRGTKKGTKVRATYATGCPGLGHDTKVKLRATVAVTCDSAVVDKLIVAKKKASSPSAVSFAKTIRPLLNTSCAAQSGCHGGVAPAGPGLDLSADRSYTALVNVASKAKAGAVLVKPSDPKGSYCLQKIQGAAGIVGAPMPLGTPLSPSQIKAVSDWIAQGAQNN